MAAMFEVAAKDSPFVPSPMGNRPSRACETYRLDTPSPKSLNPARSSWSIGKANIEHEAQTSSGSIETRRSQRIIHRAAGADAIDPQADKSFAGSLRHTTDIQMYRTTPTKAPTFNEEGAVPNLGTMVSQPDQPPVAQHVSFPRPPSSTSLSQAGEDYVPRRPATPGGNSVLHAQIRTLQRQLETKVEEAASLRRQLETRDDMDIGLLSEQLRSAKRECAMWKGRAEAAEKRVAALERFTRRLRGIKAGDAQDDYDDASSGEKGSFETMVTEDDGVVASRIKMALMGMDGARSNDGGASAWWNGRRSSIDQRLDGRPQHHYPTNLTEEDLHDVVEAVRELLAEMT